MRDATTRPPADAELAVTALRYAAAEMAPAEAEAFEARLANDQTARDALAEAVRLSAAASGAPVPTPDPLVKQAVAERLHPTWLSRLFPRRPYRGHPAVWAGLGGSVAAAVAVTVAVGVSSQNEPAVAYLPMRQLPTVMTASADPVVESTAAPLVVCDPPVTHHKLNPMGMDKLPADTAGVVYPMPTITLTPAAAPAKPAVKGPDDKVAEVPNEADPMGDPAVGMMMSKR
jgi:hypothetical protein